MGLVKTCPHCVKPMSPKELRAYSSWFGMPRVAPCPRCGARLRWRPNDWWLAHAGAVVVVGGATGLLAIVVQWIGPVSPGGFVGIMLAGAVIILIAVTRLRLEGARPPDEPD